METEDGLHGWGEAYVTPRQGAGDPAMPASDGEACHRPQRVEHPPHCADHVRGLRNPPRIARSAVGVERAGDRHVGHRGKARGIAAVQHTRRSVARTGARLCQRLVERIRADRGQHTASTEGEGDGVHRAEVGSVSRTLAQLHPSRGRGARGALCPRDARGAGAGLHAAGGGASPARADACDPHRQAHRRVRHRLVRGTVPVRQYRAGGGGAACTCRCRS